MKNSEKTPIVVALIGAAGAILAAIISAHFAASAADSADRAATIAAGTHDFDLHAGTYDNTRLEKGDAAKKQDTDAYFFHVSFKRPFADAPRVYVAMTGQNLFGSERFQLYPANITKEGFDVALQVWHDNKLPEDVVASWIAVKKDAQDE